MARLTRKKGTQPAAKAVAKPRAAVNATLKDTAPRVHTPAGFNFAKPLDKPLTIFQPNPQNYPSVRTRAPRKCACGKLCSDTSIHIPSMSKGFYRRTYKKEAPKCVAGTEWKTWMDWATANGLPLPVRHPYRQRRAAMFVERRSANNANTTSTPASGNAAGTGSTPAGNTSTGGPTLGRPKGSASKTSAGKGKGSGKASGPAGGSGKKSTSGAGAAASKEKRNAASDILKAMKENEALKKELMQMKARLAAVESRAGGDTAGAPATHVNSATRSAAAARRRGAVQRAPASK